MRQRGTAHLRLSHGDAVRLARRLVNWWDGLSSLDRYSYVSVFALFCLWTVIFAVLFGG